jgi:hypothetical protein
LKTDNGQEIEFLGTRDDGYGFIAWFRTANGVFGLNRGTLERRMALQRRVSAYVEAMAELTEREGDEDGDGETLMSAGYAWCGAGK